MKIGIITHYYKSENYGGNLQAYALCEYIKKLNLDAEQISYVRKSHSLKYYVWKTIRALKNYKNVLIWSDLKKRRDAILKFNQGMIKHSEFFTDKTLKNANNKYDVFITGSDQVWHPSAVCPAYLLDFADKSKTKISYAASFAMDNIPEEKKEMYKESLKDFSAISVREKNAVDIVKNLTEKSVECTLDPTLLLSRKDWDEVSEEKNIPEKYIFTYFLGNSENHRNIAKEYAEKNNLKIVTLPFLTGKFRKSDKNFGDYRLFDVSPAQFISLVKNAECIFTDSFHASVFSIIYNKEFFVFERSFKTSMGSRLNTLTEMFDVTDRFLNTKEKCDISYIELLNPIDYSKEFEKFNEAKKKSEEFLKINLKKEENNEG